MHYSNINIHLLLFFQANIAQNSNEMGNTQLCEKCQSFQSSTEPKYQYRKRNPSRAISWSTTDKSQVNFHNPKIVKCIQNNIYEVIYPQGGVYRGQMAGQLREGKGKHTWLGGLYYQGMWKNDKSCGFGILKTLDFEFEGQFEGNSIIKGKMVVFNKKNQEIYEGQFKDFMYHGLGVLTVRNQFVYEGQFLYHKRQGKGKIVFTNMHEYQGQFKKGAMDGRGVYKCPQFQYVGEFQKGKIHGQGKCVWKNGTVYFGNYVNGLKDGYGQYVYQDGRIYKGVWKKGKPFQLSFTFGKKDRAQQI